MSQHANPFDALDGLSGDLPQSGAPDGPFRERGFVIDLHLPDLWQQEAIRALKDGRDVIVDAPTGAGKTYIFENFLTGGRDPAEPTRGKPALPDYNARASSEHGRGHPGQAVYTVPTRALANDKLSEWRRRGWDVGIATGDLAENLDAPVLVATLETQRERLLRADSSSLPAPRLLVIDEYQMIADERRGLNYELAIAIAPRDTQLLLLSGSVANPEDLAAWLMRLDRGRMPQVITTRHRPVPLDDIHIEALPNDAPRSVRNHWQRLAVGTLMSDFGPLLVFAPQRAAAEKIARKIAGALPADDPLPLDERAVRAAGPELTRLLRKRVAWHHSGLSYAQRAGVIEPLAKAGQLRVIVATTGLAAGINFSVRSVHITDRFYRHGPYLHELGGDELLQMFGRAGRRGLDEQGFVISSDTSPRLADARPRQLRRGHELDWPTLLRVMARAADRGEAPFPAAADLRDRLFSEQRIRLGFGFGKSEADRPPANLAQAESTHANHHQNLFGLGPAKAEVQNSASEWENYDPAPEKRSEVALRDAHGLVKNRWQPALSNSVLVQRLLPVGARLTKRGGGIYGFEINIANRRTDMEGDCYRLNKRLRALTKRQGSKALLARDRIEALIPTALEKQISPGFIDSFVERGDTLHAVGDLSRTKVTAYRDLSGKWLIDPQRRRVEQQNETHYTNADSGAAFSPAPDSAAWAWRKLGLIDATGAPTLRGRLFSYFQHGEGLAIAAAILDDDAYPIGDLVHHLANLRGSHRFESARPEDSGGSERLAYVCRQAYGTADFPGYLELGLPPGFGEGTAEAVADWLSGDAHAAGSRPKIDELSFGPGDIERAHIEWLSLLRHICHAPDLDVARWRQLKKEAGEHLAKHQHDKDSSSASNAFGSSWIDRSVLERKPKHRLTMRQLRGG